MHWEIGTDLYTLPCVKQRASGNLLYSPRSSARCSVVTEMGGMERGGWEGDPRGKGYTYAYS